MTSPTRDEIFNAYEALETLTDTCIHSSEQAEELRDLVRLVLPPIPQPTMAEVEWDDDKHYLAEAEQVARGNVIMLEVANTGEIRCLTKGLGEIQFFLSLPDTLTPTGRRYALTEVQDD